MKVQIKYSVITSIDCEKGYFNAFKPEILKDRKFTYKSEDSKSEYEIKNFYHKKYVSLFDNKQVLDLLKHDYFSTRDTMGALSLEFGWCPAISIDFSNSDAIVNSYISPVITNTDEIFNILETLPKEMQEIKKDQINKKIDRILEILKDSSEYEIHLPNSFNVELNQLEISF